MNHTGSRERDVRHWLAAYRIAGCDIERAREVEEAYTGRYNDAYIAGDMTFLDREDIHCVWDDDAQYPFRFEEKGGRRPRLLFCYGELSLFNRPSVCICGARDASSDGLEAAFACARELVRASYAVVSGYARGVDLSAHLGALEADGDTIALLPYGFSRFGIRKDLHDFFDPAHFLAATELPPTYPFIRDAALRRNGLMATLAEAVIVVEPGESGGTWYTADRAAEMNRPLFFCEGGRPEIIPRMEKLGAARIPFRNGVPCIDELVMRCGR